MSPRIARNSRPGGAVIGLLQRVTSARVDVEGVTVGEIAGGLLVFVCAEPGDSEASAEKLLHKLLAYRVFPDGAGKMNRSVRDTCGGVLLVPQFTLGADTSTGTRPSFSAVAAPEHARRLFEHMLGCARSAHDPVASGRFGERMEVTLVNDGPVTFWLRVAPNRVI